MKPERESVDYRALMKEALIELEELQRRLQSYEAAAAEPVAIVGIGCRFPGASGPAEFWELLRNGVDAITEVPRERWNIDDYYDPDPATPGKLYARGGGFLQQVERFDADFFNIAPREARKLDPQHRLLLETAWEALEDAGIAAESLAGSNAGVFIGISSSDLRELLVAAPPDVDAYAGTGTSNSIASGRLSYFLGLHGPSVSVDTACSSSLVTVHQACQSLRSRECDVALAGGVNVLLTPTISINHCRSRMLAPDSRCKTFDASADGFVRSEGCGIVVLRRLGDAVAAGDNIVALIRGSAINQDGHTSGITVPSGPSQQNVIRAALANAGVRPAEIGYVEAHGTGTALGDPIEMGAIGAVFGRERAAPLAVGSVKANIGHLETAAGVAGLIKAALCLRHGEIPPQLHFTEPSPRIDWQEIPVVVPVRLMPWPAGMPRLAGVSSFGFSGTNVHVVLEAAPPAVQESLPDTSGVASSVPESQADRPGHVLALSAKSESALRELAARYAAHLSRHSGLQLADWCFSANTGRSHFSHRLALTARSMAQVCDALNAFGSTGASAQDLYSGAAPSAADLPPVVFLFTGQGSQYCGMGRELYLTEPVFRRSFERCEEILRPRLGMALSDIVYADVDAEGSRGEAIHQTAYTQPALFALEYALAELLQSWGIKPDIVLGHSVGEYVAACRAGVFGLEDALELVASRAGLMQSLPQDGAMAAVFAGEERVRASIDDCRALVSIAAVNGPGNVVISGDRRTVLAVTADLESKGIESRLLKVSHAFHSPLMAPMLDRFTEIAAGVRYSAPDIDIVSNLTGTFNPSDMTTALYWRRHVSQPVQFAQSLQAIGRRGHSLFVEIGPQPALLALGKRCIPEPVGAWISTLRPGRSDWSEMLRAVAQLYRHGVNVDWKGFERSSPRARLALPTYPWQRQRYWTDGLQAAPQPPAAMPLAAAGDGKTELYEVEWIGSARPPAASTPPERRNWLIVADRQGVGTRVAALMEASGLAVTLAFEDDVEAVIDSLPYQGSLLEGVLFLRCLDVQTPAENAVSNLSAIALDQAAALLALTRMLTSRAFHRPPQLWVVTRQAEPVHAGLSIASLAQAPVGGLCKVIALEFPEFWGGAVDVADDLSSAGQQIFAAIQDPDGEDRIAYRNGERYVPRLARQTRRSPSRDLIIDRNGTYLITGGAGAFGLRSAEWLARRGAGHIVLAGRRPALSAQIRDKVSGIENGGCRIDYMQADVSRTEDVARVCESLGALKSPLRGVLHAAGLPGYRLLPELTLSDLESVMAAKVAGTWNLYQQTKQLPLDFFVCFSSMVSVWGGKGQAHYVAANQFLDSFAHFARGRGFPALSVNWGPLLGGGMLFPELARELNRIGVETSGMDNALTSLEYLISDGAVQTAAVNIDWRRFKGVFETRRNRPLFERMSAAVHAAAVDSIDDSPMRTIRQALPAERAELLLAHVRSVLGAVLGLDSSQLPDGRKGFFDLGLDSLTAMELRERLESDLGVSLPPTVIFDFPAAEALSRHLCAMLFPDVSNEKSLEDMTEDEVAALLIRKIGAV